MFADLLVGAAESTASGGNPAMYAGDLVAIVATEASWGAVDLGVTLAGDRVLALAWGAGWQPREVLHQVRMHCGRAIERAARHAIAADRAGHTGRAVDPRWCAQLDELCLPEVGADRCWWQAWSERERLDTNEALERVIALLTRVGTLPPIDVLVPPPGGAGGAQSTARNAAHAFAGPSTSHDPVLDRIRALLAKAESTTFEAEAVALTAKAQELMTRHAIDSARLHASGAGDDARPVTVRVPIDPPYVKAKSLLLQHVAAATRCTTVMLTGLSMSAVVGFAEDVRAVEVLFTSLLVQAQSALAEAARNAPAGTRVRRQGFRSAFLMSYATRIGARLAEINRATLAAEADSDASFVPVLRSRRDAVEEEVQRRFGKLRSTRVRRRGGYDALGWDRGRRAADEARLTAGDLAAGAA